MDNVSQPPSSPEGEFREGPGFHPESTEKIIKDIATPEEKKPDGLKDFFKKNAIKVAPLALLLAAATGRWMNGNNENVTMSDEDHRAVAEWQMDAGKRIDNYEHDVRSNWVEDGKTVMYDKDGKEITDGYVNVTLYPIEKFNDGAVPSVVASIPLGTEIKRVVERGSQDQGEDKITYATARCENVGDLRDPQNIEKKIQLPDGSICVFPWKNAGVLK